jgi:hypothetical protein
MINIAPLIADIDLIPKPGETTQVTQSLSHSAKGALIILGALALVAAAIFLWAAVVRKPRKRKHSYRHWHTPKPAEGKSGADEEKSHHHHGGAFHRRRRHRRHHRDRPLNPTLAETGGLPPVRKGGAPPPPP